MDCDDTYHHEYQCQVDIEYIVHQISLENPKNHILIIHMYRIHSFKSSEPVNEWPLGEKNEEARSCNNQPEHPQHTETIDSPINSLEEREHDEDNMILNLLFIKCFEIFLKES